MAGIEKYIADLWKPETFSAKEYRNMDLDEIEVIVRAKLEGNPGRRPYSLGEIVEYIWIEGIGPEDPLKGMDIFGNLESLVPDLLDLSDLRIDVLDGDGLDELLHGRQKPH